jgi:hypothetical protein
MNKRLRRYSDNIENAELESSPKRQKLEDLERKRQTSISGIPDDDEDDDLPLHALEPQLEVKQQQEQEQENFEWPEAAQPEESSIGSVQDEYDDHVQQMQQEEKTRQFPDLTMNRMELGQVPEYHWNEEQRLCIERAKLGDSLMVSGGAYTGKTTVLRWIASMLQNALGRRVCYVSASNAVAASSGYASLKSWLRLDIGERDIILSPEWLIKTVLEQTENADTADMLKGLQVLIIDDMQYCSAPLFSSLDKLLLKAANVAMSQKAFGGVQIIAAADFTSSLHDRPCVQAARWSHMFPGQSAGIVKLKATFSPVHIDSVMWKNALQTYRTMAALTAPNLAQQTLYDTLKLLTCNGQSTSSSSFKMATQVYAQWSSVHRMQAMLLQSAYKNAEWKVFRAEFKTCKHPEDTSPQEMEFLQKQLHLMLAFQGISSEVPTCIGMGVIYVGHKQEEEQEGKGGSKKIPYGSFGVLKQYSAQDGFPEVEFFDPNGNSVGLVHVQTESWTYMNNKKGGVVRMYHLPLIPAMAIHVSQAIQYGWRLPCIAIDKEMNFTGDVSAVLQHSAGPARTVFKMASNAKFIGPDASAINFFKVCL